MKSSLFSRFGRACRVPAGAAAASATAFMLGEVGTKNTSRRFASNASASAAETLLQNTSKTTTRKSATVASSSAGINSNKAGGNSMLQWYEKHLKANPVRTKMVTGGILWGAGDVVAQAIPRLFYPPAEDEKVEKKVIAYDYARTGRAVIFGTLIHAPCAHVHYNFLESITVKAGLTGLKIPVFKAFVEQFVYWSWLSNSLYHGAMGAMQGQNSSQIYDRIADVLWETQKAQWVFWIPIQLLNFRFVPVRHQLNVVLLTSVVWTALLSAWYPPEEPKKEEKKQE